MSHRLLFAGFFALLALLQAVLAIWLAVAVVQMLWDPERFQHAEVTIGIALALAVAFAVTTRFSAKAASAIWAQWKTGRRESGPSHSGSEQDQTE